MKKYWHTFVVNLDIGVCCIRCGQRARFATNDCPGRHLDEIETMGVKEGLLDFREGTWVPESSNSYKHGHGVYSVAEIDDEAHSSFWNYLPFVTGALLLFVCIASIYELFIKAG